MSSVSRKNAWAAKWIGKKNKSNIHCGKHFANWSFGTWLLSGSIQPHLI